MLGWKGSRTSKRVVTLVVFNVAAMVGALAMAAPGDISTYAGVGSSDASLDLSYLTGTFLANPQAVAADASGNVLIADTASHRVFKLAPSGSLTTVAGNGARGFDQESRFGKNATATELNYPAGVAVDAAGAIYIADSYNQMIRKVSPTGSISTVAGIGRSDGAGNGIGCPVTQLPAQCSLFLGDGAPATLGSLNKPQGVAVGADGTIYIADTNNNRIRKVSGGNISTVAGTGAPTFSGDGGQATAAALRQPWGVAVSGNDLLIADTGNNRIRKVDLTSGVITTVAGNGLAGSTGDGGLATAAAINFPGSVAVNGAGELFITDTKGHKIRKVDTSGTISTLAGTGSTGSSGDGGPATSATLSDPYGVAVDPSGNAFIADTWNDRIRKVSTSGTITTVAGTATQVWCCNDTGKQALEANLLGPGDVASVGGSRFIADTQHHRIVKIDASGTVSTFAGQNLSGFSGDGGPATSAKLNLPQSVAADSSGNIYVADMANRRIRKITPAGVISTFAGNGIKGLSGDGGPATSASIGDAFGVAVDADGNVYIADSSNDRIRKVDTSGIITTIAGSGTVGSNSRGMSGDGGPATSAKLNGPRGVAVDSAGNVYIADTRNSKIRKVDTSGIITTFAGKGPLPCTMLTCDSGAYLGDDGPAADAYLNNPWDVAVDSAGNVWIADTSNSSVRKVDTGGTITSAGGGFPLMGGSQSSPQGVGVDSSGDVYVADTGSDSILLISAT